MNINRDTSLRITLLRFPLIVGVVLIHSAGGVKLSAGKIMGPANSYFTVFFQNIVSGVFASLAIPLFFTMAGFLFFKEFSLTFSVIKRKIGNRVKTLVVPYLAWNTANLLFYLILTSIPAFSFLFSGIGQSKFVANYVLHDYVVAFVGIPKYPIAYQFWFIRDLIILMFFSPFIWLIGKYTPISVNVVIFMFWLLCPTLELPILACSSILFFYLGALASIKDIKIEWVDLYGKWLLLVYTLLAFVDAALMADRALIIQIHRTAHLLGILAVWYLAGKVANIEKIKSALIKMSGFSFFVYAAHDPLLNGIKKIVYMVFSPSTSLGVNAVYLIAPLITIIITLSIASIMKRKIPEIFKVITGGRT